MVAAKNFPEIAEFFTSYSRAGFLEGTGWFFQNLPTKKPYFLGWVAVSHGGGTLRSHRSLGGWVVIMFLLEGSSVLAAFQQQDRSCWRWTVVGHLQVGTHIFDAWRVVFGLVVTTILVHSPRIGHL